MPPQLGLTAAAGRCKKPENIFLSAFKKSGISTKYSQYSQCLKCHTCKENKQCTIPLKCDKCEKCKHQDTKSKNCRRLLLRFTREEIDKIKPYCDNMISSPEAMALLGIDGKRRSLFYTLLKGIENMNTRGTLLYEKSFGGEYPNITAYLTSYRGNSRGNSHLFTLAMVDEMRAIKKRYFSELGMAGPWRIKIITAMTLEQRKEDVRRRKERLNALNNNENT